MRGAQELLGALTIGMGSARSEGGGWRESKKSNEPSNLPRMYKNSRFYALIDFKIAKNAVFLLLST